MFMSFIKQVSAVADGMLLVDYKKSSLYDAQTEGVNDMQLLQIQKSDPYYERINDSGSNCNQRSDTHVPDLQ